MDDWLVETQEIFREVSSSSGIMKVLRLLGLAEEQGRLKTSPAGLQIPDQE